MKPYLLLAFTCMLFISAKAQSKESVFKRVDSIIQRTNGFKSPEMNIIRQQFGEKLVRLEGSDNTGEKSANEFSRLNWQGMEFNLESMEVKGLVKVSISMDEEVTMKSYINGKLEGDEKMGEVIFFVKEADKEAINRELSQLKIYTWPELVNISKMDRQRLTQYISSKLNKAGKEYNISVKSINECEMTFKNRSDEITIPTRIREIHSDRDSYLLCYGKAKAQFTIRTGNTVEKDTDEHPDLDFDFDNDYDEFYPVEFAIKQLSKMCQR